MTTAASSRKRGAMPQFTIMLSSRFLAVSFVSAIVIAFSIGAAARKYLLNLRGPYDAQAAHTVQVVGSTQRMGSSYTSRNFETEGVSSSSSVLVARTEKEPPSFLDEKQECVATEVNQSYKQRSPQKHLAAGQHLLVDIKGVSPEFLNSQEQLGNAIVETIHETGLTLLSYHCHTLVPFGVSCVGVLLESHISLHTWPAEGVITLDLFTCGDEPLIPVVPIIKRLFGIGKDTETVWSHKMRGFRPKPNLLQSSDFGLRILGVFDLEVKQEVLSLATAFHQIDIYDVVEASLEDVSNYQKSLVGDDSYQSRHSDLYVPDRVVLLDGVLQSTRLNEAPYHEALVHPALISHDSPERVAIIGGGEGATLREVLKHSTVQEAIMVEIDEEMVNASRYYLSEWNDCSEFSTASCFDDERTKIYYEDAQAWFIDRYLEETKSHEKLDIIIMDADDPESHVDFADVLYDNQMFFDALYAALSDDGILIVQMGEGNRAKEPEEINSKHRTRAKLRDHLVRCGFESMHIYEEGHCGFGAPWTYLVATKEFETRMNWYRNEAEYDIAIRYRMLPTKSGKTPLKYFDGATMVSYQNPHKTYETIYCRQQPQPEECEELRGFDPELHSYIPTSDFEVRTSGAGKSAGRGVFAKVEIPKGSVVSIQEGVENVNFNPNTHEVIEHILSKDHSDALEIVYSYMYGYGFQSSERGGPEIFVDSGIMCFVNHGCSGTHNLCDPSFRVDDTNADPDSMPLRGQDGVHNPVRDRHFRQLESHGEEFLRNLEIGEEILGNYLAYVGDERDWKQDVLHSRQMCSGLRTGIVTRYEEDHATKS